MNNTFAYLNNEIVPIEEAFLHVRDLSIQRGYGVFDFFRVHGGRPLFLDEYIRRFYRSAEIMHLAVPHTPGELTAVIGRLVEKNNMSESGIKMILTGGYSDDGYHPGEPNLIITQHLFSPPSPEQIKKGVKIITHEYCRDLPAAKTINYSMGIWLMKKIKESQASDILYHQQNTVSEFPRCNFFIVKKDNTIVTPASGVLHGITRKNVLNLAAKRYAAKEDIVTLEDIHQAKEAFLTSTTKRIVPIVQINDTLINDGKPGEVSLSLLSDLIALEDKPMEKVGSGEKLPPIAIGGKEQLTSKSKR